MLISKRTVDRPWLDLLLIAKKHLQIDQGYVTIAMFQYLAAVVYFHPQSIEEAMHSGATRPWLCRCGLITPSEVGRFTHDYTHPFLFLGFSTPTSQAGL